MKIQTNYHLLMLTLPIQITVVEKEVIRMIDLVQDHENAAVAVVVVDQTIGVVDPDRGVEGVITGEEEVVLDQDRGVGVMIEGITTDVRGQGVEVQEIVDRGNVV